MVLRCVEKIKPVEAINIGLTSSKEKIKKSLIKNNSSSICMAINDIYKYKKNNCITLVMFILVFYLSTLFLNIANSMLTLDDNLYKIFGTANGDLVIVAPSDIDNSIEEIKEYLDRDNRVKDYYLWDVIRQNKVGINIMKKNNLSIGDYIELNIEGESREFLIVGSFSSMMSNGQTLRLTRDALTGESSGNVAFVKLKNLNDYKELKKSIESKFDGITIDKIYSPLKDTASQVV